MPISEGMSAIAAVRLRTGGRGIKWGPAAVAAVSLLSAMGFVALRLDRKVPYAFSPSAGMCGRLRGAGLAITPADWFCQPLPWTARASYVSASLLLAIGFVLPCLVLAATGRRVTAIAPLLLAPALVLRGLVLNDHWWSGTWRDGTVEGGAVMLLLLLAPVAAAIVALRPSERPPRRDAVPLLVCAATWLLLAIPIAGIVELAKGISVRHFEALGGTQDGSSMLLPAAGAMALFGSLLGPDRRWWPWSLVPVSVLLSAGPSMALIVGPVHLTDWSHFGAVVPLFAVGMVASAWRPLAGRVTGWIRRGTEPTEAPTARPLTLVDPNRVRPTVILNAVGAGVLIMSLVAFRGDPLPAQIGTAQPTYTGVRASTMDVRTRQLLHRALDDMEGYRAEQGSYRGFDAEVAAASDPALTWQSGVPAAADDGARIPELTMGIVTASETTARVVAVSPTGNAFCIQRESGAIAFGVGPGRNNVTSAEALDAALAACGSTPWTSQALRPFPVATLCTGMEEDLGYPICRMVQVVMTQTLERTGPEPAL